MGLEKQTYSSNEFFGHPASQDKNIYKPINSLEDALNTSTVEASIYMAMTPIRVTRLVFGGLKTVINTLRS